MGVKSWNLWKYGIFKNIRYIFSSEHRIQLCVFVSETGIISMERLKLATGYCLSEADKIAYAVIQKLKLPMEGVDDLVLMISERSYMPLDPLGKLSAKEKAALEPIRNIAKAKHAEVRSQIADANKQSSNAALLRGLAYIALCGALLIAIVTKLKGG